MEKTASKDSEKEFTVLIVAAGTGERFENKTPKQYHSILGKPVLRHTIESFLNYTNPENIHVVIHNDHKEQYSSAVDGLKIAKPVFGGKDRKESVYNGLKHLSNLKNEDIILIHDAARPLICPKNVNKLVQQARKNKVATLATKVSDTLKHNDGTPIDRSELWALQTPQAFQYGTLLEAHRQAKPGQNYTDDTSLTEELGIKTIFVDGSRQNIKITWPDDVKMIEKLMKHQTITRTGTGFDVHKFDQSKSGPIRLCGINIEHEHALQGHSDADVGLHAITDALLGAAGKGDIGEHFPPSDPQWKNADSAVFLQKAVELIKQQHAEINNIDLTLICEKPKITPHKSAMETRIAEICSIDTTQINIKATTTEGLGFTGRGEGIAAQATATITTKKKHD